MDYHLQSYYITVDRTFINQENVSFTELANQLMYAFDIPLPFNNEPDEVLTDYPTRIQATGKCMNVVVPVAGVKLVEVDVNLMTIDVLLVYQEEEDVQLQHGKPISRFQMVKSNVNNHERLKEPTVALLLK